MNVDVLEHNPDQALEFAVQTVHDRRRFGLITQKELDDDIEKLTRLRHALMSDRISDEVGPMTSKGFQYMRDLKLGYGTLVSLARLKQLESQKLRDIQDS